MICLDNLKPHFCDDKVNSHMVITEHICMVWYVITIMKYLELDYKENRMMLKRMMLMLMLAMVRNSWRMASQWWGFVLDRVIQ